MRTGTLVASVASVVFLLGCSGTDKWAERLPETVEARGVVLLDGKPVEGASVVFVPVDPSGHQAYAVTDEDGEFELRAFPAKSGAVPGKYKVTVSKTVETGEEVAEELGGESETDEGPVDRATVKKAKQAWANALPAKYANPKTSGLTAEIPPEGTDSLRIELSSK